MLILSSNKNANKKMYNMYVYGARFCESIIQMLPVNKNVLCIESSIKRLGIVSYIILLGMYDGALAKYDKYVCMEM